MFGTIAHFRAKPGAEEKVMRIDERWNEMVRPKVPGPFFEMAGTVKGKPGHMVMIALCQDEATYRAMSDLPEMHAVYEEYRQLMESEPEWEDVEMTITRNELDR